MTPVVSKMTFNLSEIRFGNVLGEPRKRKHPRIKITTHVDNTHLFIIVAYNLYKIAHNVGEKSNSTKLDYYTYDSFLAVCWEVISVAYSAKSCHCEVTAYY